MAGAISGSAHAFVANMTGNTVLLGTAVFLHGDLLHPGISLACYAVGASLAAYLTRNVRQGSDWPRAVFYTLSLEAILLTATTVGWTVAGRDVARPGSTPDLNILLGCAALAIGIQSGASYRQGIAGMLVAMPCVQFVRSRRTLLTPPKS